MYEINLKVKHDCPYLSIANVFDEPIYTFCSQIFDLVIIPREITHHELNQVKKFISDLDSLEILSSGDLTGSTYLYFRCMCATDVSISPRIQQHGGIVQDPIRYEGGWEWYKIICLNQKTQSIVLKYIQTLEEYELVSIRDLGRDGVFKTQFLSVHQMIGTMTDRQIEVLVEAYKEGYYEIPRNTTTKQIADKFEVSRAATEKSLRKAENAIMQLVIPYMIFHQRIHNNSPQEKYAPIDIKS